MTFPDSLMSIIPEEFTDLKNFASDFRRNYTDLLARTIGYAHLWHSMALDQGSAYRNIDIATMKRLVYEAVVKHATQARKA